jgi:UDP-N-acetylmuramoyl-tripeptide--D-alanyl-D-alanine ligase
VIAMTLAEVAEATGGTLGGGADPAQVAPGPVEFDSRAVTPGCLFLALPGERVDGHDYVGAALAAGAVAALVSKPVHEPHVLVHEGLSALARLAMASVRRLPDLTVVGITGSSGKTSTKDLAAGLLSRLGPTVAPRASFNNELGHPYTVLRADPGTRYLVLELSARGLGHIRALTDIAPPRIGVVLNVGSAHLGEFGSREVIAEAKGELIEALPPAPDGGLAVLNADDPLVAAMAERARARVVTVGRAPWADLRAADVRLADDARASFELVTVAGSAEVRLSLVGEHHVGNALAAAAVALEQGLPLAQAAETLSAARPRSGSRMATSKRADGVLVVDDAYNANPESMRAAIATLARLGEGRRSWAVLGHMAELGEASAAAHEELGRVCATAGISHVLAVGDGARAIADAATRVPGWAGTARWVGDLEAAGAVLHAELRSGDVVLFKASHAVGLERLAQVVRDDVGPDMVTATGHEEVRR